MFEITPASRPIVYATDFSPASTSGAEVAVQLANRLKAPLPLVHVSTSMTRAWPRLRS